MKIFNWKYLLLPITLISVLGSTITVAASGPDPKVRIHLRNVVKNTNGTFNFTIVGTVRNIGSSDFISGRGQQILVLAKVRGGLVQKWNFVRVNRGRYIREYRHFRNQRFRRSARSGGYYVPTYRLAIVYSPDIFIDRVRTNNDTNLRNNSATLMHNTLQAALDRASRPTRTPYSVKPVFIPGRVPAFRR